MEDNFSRETFFHVKEPGCYWTAAIKNIVPSKPRNALDVNHTNNSAIDSRNNKSRWKNANIGWRNNKSS